MMASEKLLNINVGVLGHVDSGKTSLGNTPGARQHRAANNAVPSMASQTL